MEGHRSRLPLAILVAVVAAGVATLILRPRSGLIEPAAVEETAYFSAQELDRARDFRGPQRLLGLAGLGLTAGTLALVALRPPRRVRRALERMGGRPLLGGAAVGAGISLSLVVVTLPIAAVRHERAVDVGLSTQSWGAWLGDLGKAASIEALFAAGGGILVLVLMRRFPRRWWGPAAASVVALTAAFAFLSPILLDPLFNRFTPLPEGKLRSEVIELARDADVDVGEVYRVDASRRTTGANAYVGGLGETKRVVLYDNLIEDFPPEQVRSVVAHELAHVKHRDLLRGLLWIAIVAPAAMFLVQQLTQRLARAGDAVGPREAARRGRWVPPDRSRSLPGPSVLPTVALSLGLVSFAVAVAGNLLSREVEGRADAFALRVTRDPAAFIALERRLATTNVSDPDPPAVLHALFGTHPTTVERIGIGERWARQH
jgi:STE24 endopeptidase